MASDRIWIEGIEFYAYHGVSDSEQQVGHRYQVDLVLELSLQRASETDHLEDTVSYSEVARLVTKVGTQSQHRLMEALAGQIARTLLETYPAVECVTVRVSKRLPPAGLVIERAGVEINKSRAG